MFSVFKTIWRKNINSSAQVICQFHVLNRYHLHIIIQSVPRNGPWENRDSFSKQNEYIRWHYSPSIPITFCRSSGIHPTQSSFWLRQVALAVWWSINSPPCAIKTPSQLAWCNRGWEPNRDEPQFTCLL